MKNLLTPRAYEFTNVPKVEAVVRGFKKYIAYFLPI